MKKFFYAAILGSLIFSGLVASQSPQEIDSIQLEPTNGTRLEIPAIDFSEELVEGKIQDKTFIVPDYQAAYYQSDNNLFIYGHSSTAFTRLSERPERLSFSQDGVDTIYELKTYQNLPKEQISMDNLLTYPGAILMTCSGEHDENRLILFYEKVAETY